MKYFQEASLDYAKIKEFNKERKKKLKEKSRKERKEIKSKRDEYIDKILELVFNSFQDGELAVKPINIFGYDFECGFFDNNENPIILNRLTRGFIRSNIIVFKKDHIRIRYFGKTSYLKQFLKHVHITEEDLLRLQQTLFSIL